MRKIPKAGAREHVSTKKVQDMAQQLHSVVDNGHVPTSRQMMHGDRTSRGAEKGAPPSGPSPVRSGPSFPRAKTAMAGG